MLEVFELSPEEINLIKVIRDIKFGVLEQVVVQDGKPVMVKNVTQNVKLTIDKKTI